MKIILTGAHGTGKTTILEHYKSQYPVITEVVRTLMREGVKINEMGDEEGQKIIFDTHIKLLSSNDQFIADRGPTDALAYTIYHTYVQKKFSEDEVIRETEKLRQFIKENKDIIIWCYFPIEFGVVNDGVRSIDEEFRYFISRTIKQILDDNNIPYHIIHGTIEQRIKQIDKIIKDNE